MFLPVIHVTVQFILTSPHNAGNLPSLDGRTINRKAALNLLKNYLNRNLDASSVVASAAKASGERKAREDLAKAEKQMALLQEQLANAKSQYQKIQKQLHESKAREAAVEQELVAERGNREGLEAILRLKEAKEQEVMDALDKDEQERNAKQEASKQEISKLIDQHKADAKALQDKDKELEGMVEKNNDLQSQLEDLKTQLSDVAAAKEAKEAEEAEKAAQEAAAQNTKELAKNIMTVRVVARLQQLYRKAQRTIASVKNYRRAHALDKVKTVGLTMIKSMAEARKHLEEKQRLEEEEAARKAEQEAQQQRLKQLEEVGGGDTLVEVIGG